MTISNRLRSYIAIQNKSIKEFSAHVDIPYRTLQDYLSGKRSPGSEHLIRLAQKGVDITWLLTGEKKVGIGSFLSSEIQGNSVLFADLIFVEKVGNVLTEKADAFTERFFKKNGTLLPISKQLKILSNYIVRVLFIASKMSKELEELKKMDFDDQLIIDLLTTGITEEYELELEGKILQGEL
ncbi:MAG: hypothetical protein CMN55_16370 [Sneathiella sp.]|jgi:transcriptional regulator with XRE-family HTH domain|uniref:helix-turn-helix domain-containing protein n=1 Tax=Sneathiella sp. TaxID=1964365 RepID=UPI000C4AD095|nr:helix-turn-helix transcriptional regulator [Sneathiella sp.]MAL80653.1 hypothetical protein [Sneathiella sp.]|tara:strand:- start:346 stop:891 length:546 start_codon:yes stop_codon:yes gene_type:complete